MPQRTPTYKDPLHWAAPQLRPARKWRIVEKTVLLLDPPSTVTILTNSQANKICSPTETSNASRPRLGLLVGPNEAPLPRLLDHSRSRYRFGPCCFPTFWRTDFISMSII